MMTLIIFLIVISIIILFHEFGHFIAAKLLKMPVLEFALGFGPALFKKKLGETTYRINLLPLGGYVKIFGEGEYDLADKAGFETQRPYKKLIVALSGVAMNFVLAVIVFTIYLSFTSFKSYLVILSDINFAFGSQKQVIGIASAAGDKSSPAYKTLGTTEYILDSINGQTFQNTSQVVNFVDNHKGESLHFVLSDAFTNTKKSFDITPRINPPKGERALGVVLGPKYEIYFSGIGGKLTSGFQYSIDYVQYNVVVIYNLISKSIQEHNAAPVQSSVTGPVGVYALTGYVFDKFGILGIVNWIGAISLGIGIANLLPLPILDGGLALFIIIEMIFKKPVNTQVRNILTNLSLGLLLLLVILITLNDFHIVGSLSGN